ncbi:MAG: 6-carboxytetrahydropterin synthase QueD [Planctomycetaceae bacterium]|jgi:6-pyruvoyltetrahydropterin/6-carboxytetrahydropterin synthase|nr:6-carboxytetrahydropterin synthase QueD [Planctomycetaceae bacterium]
MYTVTREFHFCYGHRLRNYNGKCAYLHGHNGRVEITLASETLDECGMVLDFGELKRTVGRWIDEHLDHKMLLSRTDPAVEVLEKLGEPIYLMEANPTAENLARLIYEQTKSLGFPVRNVTFWETLKCMASFSKTD